LLVLDPGLAGTIAEDVLEQHLIPFYDLLLEDTGDYVDVVGISDDLGAQNGLIFSPKTYRELFKPLHQRLVDHIRRLTDAKIYMHSDGSIFPLLPDLIEIGVDGLNPVQYTAKDMDLTRLKQEFGKDLGFFGGVVENAALSFQSIDEVRQLVEENVSILKRDGGFIFAPIHNISQEVPPENIIAMYQAGQKFGAY
jgi:uroporphyrinogen decarboxylase